MNGKSYSIHAGMLFKKYYCAKCGTKLEKEKTHRVVTPDDADYFEYQDYNKFPRRDYDVYDYRFKCPYCQTSISYEEQCIVSKIQKEQGSRILAASQIKSGYSESKKKNKIRALITNLAVPLVFFLIVVGFYYLRPDQFRNKPELLMAVGLITFISIVRSVLRFYGIGLSRKNRTYSYDQKMQLQKLHTYCSHNRNNIMLADKCYCFHCKMAMDHEEIVDYIDNGQTALCPKCGIDAIIPDSIDESLDDEIIAQMHEYWF